MFRIKCYPKGLRGSMAKFTDRSIAALRPKAQRYEVWDDAQRGFGVRITPRGVKSFVWVYHFDGRPRRLTFGAYPRLTLASANVKLAQARQMLARGAILAHKQSPNARQSVQPKPSLSLLLTTSSDMRARVSAARLRMSVFLTRMFCPAGAAGKSTASLGAML